MPSFWSAVAKTAWKRRRSKRIPSGRVVSKARFTASFAIIATRADMAVPPARRGHVFGYGQRLGEALFPVWRHHPFFTHQPAQPEPNPWKSWADQQKQPGAGRPWTGAVGLPRVQEDLGHRSPRDRRPAVMTPEVGMTHRPRRETRAPGRWMRQPKHPRVSAPCVASRESLRARKRTRTPGKGSAAARPFGCGRERRVRAGSVGPGLPSLGAGLRSRWYRPVRRSLPEHDHHVGINACSPAGP